MVVDEKVATAEADEFALLPERVLSIARSTSEGSNVEELDTDLVRP